MCAWERSQDANNFSILVNLQRQDIICADRTSEKLSNAIDDCRPSDNATAKVCNDRGQCICGSCSCFRRPVKEHKIYGKYCECDNFSCHRANGLICAGHGYCDCGRCHCNSDWTGDACDCPTSILTCIDPQNSRVRCNDHGDCLCGNCRCHEDQHVRYIGKYCEISVEKNESVSKERN